MKALIICAALAMTGTVAAQTTASWSVRPSGTTVNLLGLAFGDADVDPVNSIPRIVAVGEQGTILVSDDDGTSWRAVASGTTAALAAVTHVSGLGFFAVGDGGVILASADGLTWTREASPVTTRLNALIGVSAVGDSGAELVERNPDGTWQRRVVGFGARRMRGGISELAVGDGGTVFVPDASSPGQPGAPWVQAIAPTTADLHAATTAFVGEGIAPFITIVGASGTILQRTTAGIVARPSGTTEPLRAITKKMGGSVRVITGAARVDLGEFFAVGDNGTVLRSSDGLAWQKDAAPTTRHLNAVVGASSHVVAVGDGGTIVMAGGPSSSPTLVRQPVTGTDDAGFPFIEAHGAGEGALTYQWLQVTGGLPRPVGRQSGRQMLPFFSSSPAVYELYVSNAFGMVRSNPVAANRFLDLAARAEVGVGGNILIGGFAVAGASAQGRSVLVRAVGPGLADFNVSNPLAAPRLTVFAGGAPIATNTGWETNANATAIADATARVRTFPLRRGSSDSALLLSLGSGLYTAHVESADGSPGIALMEIYDVDTPGIARLINLSARAHVRSGDRVLIGGLVIDGGIHKRVLLRAAGPALAAFNVSGTLAAPKLELVHNGVLIATATAWSSASNASELRSAAASVQAFPFPEGSADAAMIAHIAGGAVTLVVSGADGGAGIALVEVYELP